MHWQAEVLIVGAGPVGLLLACELQREGVDHLLIEQAPRRTYFCKALGLTPRTLEIFEDVGIAEEAIDRGVWMSGVTIFVNGTLAKTQVWDRLPEGLPYGFLAL